MDYYQILGIEKNASDEEIKKAYKKKALKCHPDKAADDQKNTASAEFQKISTAYEVLIDNQKRQIYDTRGESGLKDIPVVNPNNDTANFGFVSRRKVADMCFVINLTLKDLLLGTVKKIKVTRQVIVHKQTKDIITDVDTTWRACITCNGQGCKIFIVQIGFFAQPVRQDCQVCAGSGVCLNNDYALTQSVDIIDVAFGKAVNHGEQQRYHGRGNYALGHLPGDIVLTVHMPSHQDGFTRVGNNLTWTQNILLSEALCGSTFKLTTLDDKEIYITYTSVSPGETKTINNFGINGGNLVINFNIAFPSLDDTQKAAILRILPNAEKINQNTVGYLV